MKDQFANYVVQKVLETCDDQQLELILTRIKVHLNALKKYTYGKHIVARVEKLVAAGGTCFLSLFEYVPSLLAAIRKVMNPFCKSLFLLFSYKLMFDNSLSIIKYLNLHGPLWSGF